MNSARWWGSPPFAPLNCLPSQFTFRESLNTMSIQVQNIHKQFGSFVALNNVSLDFPTGELVAPPWAFGLRKDDTVCASSPGLRRRILATSTLEGNDASDTHVRDRQVGFVFSTLRTVFAI